MFIATKLLTPPLQSALVHRPRLFETLDLSRQPGKRLILVSAPPGYGKTTLLAQWLQHSGAAQAWLSLDEQDNDPAVFFSYLVQVLNPHFPGLAAGLLPLLKGAQPPQLDALLGEVINRAAGGGLLYLALDDFHLIQAAGVLGLVQRLLERLPANLRLVLLTRADPLLPLARLRVRGQMLEIRERDLSFTRAEAQALLVEQMGLPLEASQVDDLTGRTEGWAASLQLAGLSLRGAASTTAFLESFGGTHRYIIDYLAEEVLSSLPDELRSFVCQAAALERFCAGLLDHALQIDNSQELLRQTEAANLFLVALDEQRTWYRFHHLLRDLLTSELAPEIRAGILRRAAGWHAAHAEPAEAVRCALVAGDMELAVGCIRAAAIPAVENGLLATALGWLDELPPESLRAEPDLAVLRGWFLIYNGRAPEAFAWLNSLTTAPTALPRPLQGMLLGMTAWLRMASGGSFDLPELLRAREMLGEAIPQFSPLLHLIVGQAQREIGDLRGALESFQAGVAQAEAANSPVTALILGNNLAFLLNNLDRRSEAQAMCEDAVKSHAAPLSGIPLIARGCLAFESGDLDTAYESLTQGINYARRLGLYEVLTVPAYHALALTLHDLGRPDEAETLLQEARRQMARSGMGAALFGLDYAAAELNLRRGRFAQAAALADQLGLPDPLPQELPRGPRLSFATSLFAARAWLADRRTSRALALLDLLEAEARRTARLTGLMDICLAKARGLHATGRDESALACLQESVDLAIPAGYCQAFRDVLRDFGPLAARLSKPAHAWLSGLAGETPHSELAGLRSLAEPPTERELELLRLASAGLSNQEIAEQLYISVGTVKWHLNNLFGKLGVRSRTQAAVAARELGLL